MDREKVIEHIKDCVKIADCQINHNWVFVRTDILRDALALLKAQEPRVMTLEEAKNAFVIEYRSGKLKEAGMTILDLDVDSANAYYGEIYRVWTSCPTDEQREATPWLTT